MNAPTRMLSTPPAEGLPRLDLASLATLSDAASLTGRGGAGFPTATKLRSIGGQSDTAVVGNAMEGEPLSGKDAVLLERVPHLVAEGLTIVADALGARRRMIGVGTHLSTTALKPFARASGIEVVPVRGGFVAGQESALVRGLSGHAAVPTDPSVRVTTRGVDGRPTLVLNVDTLAHVAMAARFGPAAATTSLYTLSGAVTRPGVVEAEHGTTLREVISRSRPTSVQAVLLGGYHGTWLPASALDVRLTREDLAPWNATVGAGVVHVLAEGSCPLQATHAIATFLADESAGQCGPCINALPRLADVLGQVAKAGATPALRAQVDRLSGLATGRGACAHPDGAVRMIGSAMRTFAPHVASHLDGRCAA